MPISETNYATKDDLHSEIHTLRVDMERNFKELMDTMIQSFHFVYEKFEKVDARFDAMDRRFDGMGRRFDRMDKRFDEADLRFERFEKSVTVQFSAVNSRFDALAFDTPRRTEHDRLTKRVETVEKKVGLQVQIA